MVGVLLLVASGTAGTVAPARFVRHNEARAILAELKGQLPPDLDSLTAAQLESAWPRWIERHDQQVRARLEQGDEDTIVNWLLFGTSFSSRPRAVIGAVQSGAAGDQELVLRRTIDLISGRMDDLLAALAMPGTDERRLFARALLERRGLRFATTADRDAARQYLMAAVIRVATEQEQIDQELGATSGGGADTEFVQRSRLFRTRGLSLDTSLITNFSIDRALAAMKARGLLKPGAVRRVAIVGPGLDFADKDVGFDIYPQQTLQPFAVLDSLKQLGLARDGDPEIVLLDISPRVIDHVTQARARAARNLGYTLNLPLPRSTPWLREVHRYWEAFGTQIGAPAQAPAPKAIDEIAELRAVHATPATVRQMSVLDVNIVTERLDGYAFDLVIATNVLIYYDVLEQALAMSNVAVMLRRGGFLLANVAAPQLASVSIRPVETTTTLYGPDIADSIVWYRAAAD